MGLHQIDSKPALTSRVERIYDVVVDMADRVVSPATRQKSWESTVAFAQENPLFFVRSFALPPLHQLYILSTIKNHIINN
jgi:hypothetical protein